jgi:hypothetical protein
VGVFEALKRFPRAGGQFVLSSLRRPEYDPAGHGFTVRAP